MKKLSIIILTLLFVQPAYGLEHELKNLAASLTKLAQDLGGGAPPPPPTGQIPAYPQLTPQEIAELEKDRPKRPLPPPPAANDKVRTIKAKLDAIFNETDVAVLTDATNRLDRSYLFNLEKVGAPQEDILKYKELMVKHTKKRIDTLYNEVTAGRLKFNIQFANSLLRVLQDNGVSGDEYDAYLQKVGEMAGRNWGYVGN
ncbi:MAG: hypothetical protein AB7F19_05350 [Candidatus Babeliales bacterium]